MIRALRLVLRSIRPIRSSLAGIDCSLNLLARIAELRLNNDGLTLLDEELVRHPRKEDMTEISFEVKQPAADDWEQ
jgi:hypothetical protein